MIRNRPEESGAASRTEQELLLLLARPRLDEVARSRVGDLIAGTPDWDHVVDLARRHGVIPLVHQRLNAHFREAVPDPAWQRLSGLRSTGAQQALQLTAALVHVLDTLESGGIRAIAYKGPALARQLYGDVAMRQYGDLDVLVEPDDVGRAIEVLESAGYHGDRLTPAREVMLLKGDKHRQLRGPGGVCLELHWRLSKSSQPSTIGRASFGDRTDMIGIGQHQVRVLKPDDLLPVLCLHGARHGWDRLSWLVDVAALIETGTVDWTVVVDTARNLRARRVLFTGLRSAERLLGARLPPAVSREVGQDPGSEALAQIVADHLLGRNPRPPNGVAFYYRALEGWRPHVRMSVGSLFAVGPADWEFISLPDSLRWGYYLIRPLRLAGRFIIRPMMKSES